MAEQRFVTYYRVSTEHQGRSGLGLDAQREAVIQFLAARSTLLIAEYTEIESGGRDDRPKLKEALIACQRNKATLLIAKLDRLARNVSFIAGLMDGDVDFVAADNPHASRLMLHLLAAFAEHEREVISQRTRAALAAAKVRGVLLGANGKILAKQHKAEAAAYALEVRPAFIAAMAGGARTTRQIADSLNQASLPSRQGGRWHPANVARTLRRLRHI